MLNINKASAQSSRAPQLQSILSLLIINIAIPYICYTVLKNYHASDVIALGVSAIAPTLESLISIIRSRNINIISLFVLGGIVISIVVLFLGGDTRILLIRESLFTGAFGILCFVSLLFPRPLMFLIGRSIIAGNDPAHIARYNQIWQNPGPRRTSRIITVVWGIVYCCDFLLRVLLAFTLPVSLVITIGPLLTGGLISISLLWTFAYVRRVRARANTQQSGPAHVLEETNQVVH